jgi:hypothetical protein
MGIQGLRVYRHRGRYLVQYSLWDSSSRFGLDVLAGIPKADATREDFQNWLTKIRKWVENKMEELKENTDRDSMWVTEDQPRNGLFMELVYELDLDNLVVHIDTNPVYRLDHVPPPSLFLRMVGFDHYGNRAFTEKTPEEYRYNWSAPPPPPNDPAMAVYKNHTQQAGPVLIHDLLSVTESLSGVECSRVAFLEILVGHHMGTGDTGHILRVLETVSSRDRIPKEILPIVISALHPMIYPSRPVDCDDFLGFMWMTDDLCLRVTTHLDDEANLQSAMGELINHIAESKEKKGVVYGILFSIFHCVIMSIDLGAGGKCQHTSALPFLPSWYAYSRSTPGITALARLGNLLNFEMWADRLGNVEIFQSASPTIQAATMLSRMPEDICYMIAWYLYTPSDILAFMSLSPACKFVGMRMLKYPNVDGYRFLKPIPQPPRNTPSSGYASDSDGKWYNGTHFALLRSGGFEAVTEYDIIVEFGASPKFGNQKQYRGFVRFPILGGLTTPCLEYVVTSKDDRWNSRGTCMSAGQHHMTK